MQRAATRRSYSRDAGERLASAGSRLVNKPHSRYQEETDRVAEALARNSGERLGEPLGGEAPEIQPKCAACAKGGGVCPSCAASEGRIGRKVDVSGNGPMLQREEDEAGELKEEELSPSEAPGVVQRQLEEGSGAGEEETEGPSIGGVPSVQREAEGGANEEAVEREAGAGPLPRCLWQAGNAAVILPLARRCGGKPLPPETGRAMGRAYGAGFSGVRLHDDPSAQAAAKALGAEAFTRGEDIYLEAGAPAPESPAGKNLLAHELAHVVQQRQAGRERQDSLNRPGDRFEQAADAATYQILRGQPAKPTVGGSPPAVQRQDVTIRKGLLASRKQVEAAVRAYLECVRREQGERSIQITPAVRLDLRRLADTNSPTWRGRGNDPSRISRVIMLENLLNTTGPRDPASLSKRVAKILPDPFDPAALRRLRICSVKQKPSLSRRAQKILKPQLPGRPLHPGPVRGSSSLERFEQGEAHLRTQQGKKGPKQIGPYGFDVRKAVRIGKKLFKQKPRLKTQPPQGRFSRVEKAIRQRMKQEDLVPAEVIRKLKRAWDRYENERGVDEPARLRELNRLRAASRRQYKTPLRLAHEIATRLDEAQRQGNDRVTLDLNPLYGRVRDQTAIIKKVERVILIVRDHLPHRASKVQRVEIRIGGKIVRVVMLRTSPRPASKK